MSAHALRTRIAVLGATGALLVAGMLGATASAAPAAHRNHYQDAQIAWRNGDSASAARQGIYWAHARTYLRQAPGDRYYVPQRRLTLLIHSPNTALTPAQIKRVRHNTSRLNHFFHTTGFYF